MGALPEDVQRLDEAYPGMALADQVRAYAAAEVAAERERRAAALMPSHPITRADSVALWHAVDAMKWAVKALRDMPNMEEHLPGEIQRLEAAQKALRKVQALVRASKGARR